jgi:hypothetical protein
MRLLAGRTSSCGLSEQPVTSGAASISEIGDVSRAQHVLRPASDRERNDLDFYQPVGIMPVLTPRSPRPPRALNQIEIFRSII